MAEEKLFGVPVEDTPLFGEPVDEDRSQSDRGRTLIGDTGIAPIDYVTEKAGQLGYALADNVIGFDDGVDTLGERTAKTMNEMGQGFGSGVVGIGEGVASVASILPDVALGTDYGDKVAEKAEAIRDTLGFTPEGFAGKATEIVTQFVAPAGLAIKGINYLNKAARAKKGLSQVPMTKTERFGLAAKELGYAGLADAIVSTDGMTTIGDWTEIGPTQTIDLIGLSNREKALARLYNKATVGLESTLLGGVAQGALVGAGKTLGSSKVGGNVKQKLDNLGQDIDNLLYTRMTAKPGTAEELGYFKTKLADAIAFSRYRGYLPDQVATKRELIDGQVQVEIKKADRILKDFDEEIGTFIKKSPEGEGTLDRVGVMTRLESYLTESDRGIKARVLKELPKPLRNNAIRMRKHIDNLSNNVLGSNFLKDGKTLPDGTNLNDLIEQNINTYLRRRYKIFEDSKYVPTEESISGADNFFRANKSATEKELTEIARGEVSEFAELTQDFLNKNGLRKVNGKDGVEIKTGQKVTDEAAKKARENFLNRYSIKSRETLGGGRMARDRLETGMFMTRENVPKDLRRLLGEVEDPMEAYLGTVADLAQFSAVDDYFGTIARQSEQNSGIGKLFVDGNKLAPEQQKALRQRGYVKLGGDDGASSAIAPVGRESDDVEKLVGRSGWGSLDGFYVPNSIYKNLTNQVLAEDTLGAQLTKAVAGTFLKLKGISQYSKTVLSPITQVRNFTTAAAFATANGNIPVFGRGGSLKDSAQAVLANVTNKGSDELFADLADAQKRGVLGTNAELREIQDSLNKGLGITARDPKNFSEAIGGFTKTGEKLAKSAGKFFKPLENAYQGSDDFWKYFNYKAEQTHIRKALEGATPEQQIAYLTKSGADVSDETAGAISRGFFEKADIDEMIANRAAQIVRDTVPNYNKASSELVRLGRRLPVGNFISFPAEIYRTGFNIVKQGLDDMASDIPAVQNRGRNRLLGFATTTAVIPAAVLETAYALSGVDQKEMDAYKRSFAPRWEKGSVLVPIGKTEDGKIKYVNFSTSNPYDVLSRFANRAMNEVDDAYKEGKDPGQVLEDVALGSLKEVFEPFMSEAMLTEALFDVSIRGGRTATGAEVYNSSDSFGTRQGKRFAHVIDTLMPNLLPVNVSGGKIEPSRVLRGIFGSEDGMISNVDKMGRERNPLSEFARQATGVSVLEFDPKRGLEYGAYRLGQQQTNAKRTFNKVTDDFNAGTSTLTNAFQTANNDKFRIDREYYRMMEDLRDMGMSNSDIRRVLKKNNIGGVKGIMRGKFEPFKVTKKNRQEMRDAGILNKFDNNAMVSIQREMRNLPLDPREERPAPVAPRPTQTPMFGVPANDPPAQTPMFGVPVEQGSLPLPQAPLTQARAPGPVNPALLGDNPFSASANAQIAARLQES